MKHRLPVRILSVIMTAFLIFEILPMSVFAEDMTQNEDVTMSDPVYSEDENAGEQVSDETEISPSTEVIGEVVEKREENVKHFMLSDSEYCAVSYPQSVHYKPDPDGEWVDIDNTLTQMTDENGETYLAPKSSPVDVKLKSETTGDSLAEYTVGGYTVSWGYDDAELGLFKSESRIRKSAKRRAADENTIASAAENIEDSAQYNHIYKNVNIEYTVTPSGLKENLVLKSSDVQNEFYSTYNIGSLTPVQTDSRTVTLYDSGVEALTISAPCMTDSLNESSEDVALTLLSAEDGRMKVKISASREWLDSPDREYPVTLDPYIFESKNSSFVNATACEKVPAGTYPYGSLLVGKNSSYGACKSYIRFNLPSLNAGDTVVGGTLNVFQFGSDTGFSADPSSIKSMTVNVSAITGAWSKETDISNTRNHNGLPAKESNVTDYLKTSFVSAKTLRTFDVGSIVKRWYNGNLANNGFVLEPSDNSKVVTAFVSSHNTSESAYMPVLAVMYVNNKGLEDRWTYHTQSLGIAGTSYINDFSGSLVITSSIVENIGNNSPASVSLIYNAYQHSSVVSGQGKAGKGWRFDFQQKVWIIPQSTQNELYKKLYQSGFRMIYTDPDGTEHYFKLKDGSTNVYVDEEGLKLTVTKGSTNEEKYFLEYESGEKTSFTYNGYVRKRYDADGNYYRYNYDDTSYTNSASKVTEIIDGGGRKTKISYNSNNTVSAVTDNSNRVTSFTYDSAGRLANILYPDSTRTYFSYDSKDRLVICQSATGENLKYFYKDYIDGSNPAYDNRVAKVIQRSSAGGTTGGYLTFSYSADSTLITDDKNRTQKYLFDNSGRTVCVTDDTGAVKYDYTAEKTGAKSNKISSVMQTGSYVDNLLENHSFEVYSMGSDNRVTFNSWPYYGSTGSVSQNSSAMLGKSCAKITKTQSGEVTIYQTVKVDEKRLVTGKEYTFTVYIKTDSGSTSTHLFANCVKKSGASNPKNQSYPSYDVNEILPGYVRQRLTFTVPAETDHVNFAITSKGSSGSTYIDCAQVEKGGGAGEYNLLENSGFNKNGNWTATNTSDGEGRAIYLNNGYAYKLIGSSSVKKCIYQNVLVNKPAADFAFSASAYAAASSVPLTSSDRFFAMNIILIFTDKTEQYNNFMFSPDIRSDIQYTSGIVKANSANKSKTIEKVCFRFVYYNNLNDAYIMKCSLNFDETGTSYTYDSNGNLISAADNAKRNQTYKYDSYSNLTESNFEDNTSYDFTYDSNGKNKHRLLSAKSKKSNITASYTYDAKGNCTGVTVSGATASDGKIVTSNNYGGTNNDMLNSSTDALGNTVSYTHDSKTGLLKTVSDARGFITSYAYDGKTDALTKVSSGSSSVQYTYNTKRQLTNIQSPSTSYTFAYDEFGNLGSVNAGSNTLVTNNYKALNDEGELKYSGLLQEQTYGNSHKVSYSYDSYDRPSEITYSGGGKTQTYKWDYDSDGRVSRYTENGSANKAFHYTYDLSGRLTQAMRKDGSEYIQPTYDSKNLTTGMKYKFAGSVISASYSYDETKDNSPDGASFDGAGRTDYAYDSLGRTSRYGVFNKNNTGVYTASYTYKKNPSDSSKTSGVVEKINYGSINVKALSYGYDKNGNITSINNTDDSVFERYSYDNLNQLTSALSEQDDYYIKYTYDTAGNILTKKTYLSAYYTSNNESLLESTVNYTYDSTWKDKLISYNGKSISYDAIGNMLSFDSQTFTWLGRRLMSYAKGGTTTNYTYNSDGIRTKKVSGSTTTDYCLNGTQVLAEKRGGTLINYFYTSNGTRVGFKTGGKVYYYVYNLQGDVTHIVDESKNIVATYRYDPFGKILNLSSLTSIGKLNPFRYRGYYYDTESNLYYLNSRYYNPEICRFINADDIDYLGADGSPLSYNLFAYCLNNPVNRFDVNGNWSMPNWLKVTVGAVAIAGLAVATVCTGGAAAVICGAALSGAIAGGASGAVMGAIGGGISGGWQGALDGACSGFMSGTLIGGATGAASAGLNIATGATTVVGNAHGSTLHKLATNMEAGKMAASGQYSQIGVNKALKTMGLNGTSRPDVIGIAKKGMNKLVEVVSPRQSTNYIINKMSNMLSNNSGSVGKIVNWVRRLFK